MNRAAGGVALCILSLAAAPPPAVEVVNADDPAKRIEARAELNTDRVRLSGEAKLTVTVEGPGPLIVTTPRPFFTKPNLWRVHADGLPVRELSAGRERWMQAYRISPLQFGKVPVPLGPLTVRAGSQDEVSIAWDEKELFHSDDIVEQVRQALKNTATMLAAGGAKPEHVARMTWYITDKEAYLAALVEIGAAWRERMGRNYPAMAVVQVLALVEDDALIEIETTAVLPTA